MWTNNTDNSDMDAPGGDRGYGSTADARYSVSGRDGSARVLRRLIMKKTAKTATIATNATEPTVAPTITGTWDFGLYSA